MNNENYWHYGYQLLQIIMFDIIKIDKLKKTLEKILIDEIDK